MPIEILMPSTGGDDRGQHRPLGVKQGDAGPQGEVLLEIETDKALVEVTAPGDGVLAAILAPDGAERVKVGRRDRPHRGRGRGPGRAGRRGARDGGGDAAAAPRCRRPAPAAVRAPDAGAGARAASRRARWHAGSRRRGRSISRTIPGSGPNGRIVKVDVEKAATSAAVAGRGADRQRPGGEAGRRVRASVRRARACRTRRCGGPSPSG